ncbi:MAG: LacI family DNA-binding transcriptional regulator [Planctomycetes bacterium]|nr:LacI family DNA-binding transcriptional regulator [Planctomycetota bacterium]
MPPIKRSARITLSAVAADAGVALSTASVILSENQEYLRNFSPSTILRVRKSAQRLGYRANLFASGLPGKGSSLFFMLAVPALDPGTPGAHYSWGLHGDLMGGVAETAHEAGVFPIVVLFKPQPGGADSQSFDRVLHGGAFGAIVCSPPAPLEKILRQRIKESQPIVVVFPERVSEWSSNVVDIDNVALGEQAGQLFARQRRRKWLIILDEENEEAHALRLRGFQKVARECRARVERLPCPHEVSADEASVRVAPWLAKFRPDAVFALASRTAQGFLHACKRVGVEAGTEVLLVGCDCSIWQTPLLPRITSLEASWRQVGETAMQQLGRMRDDGGSRFGSILLPPTLVPGDTCPPAN